MNIKRKKGKFPKQSDEFMMMINYDTGHQKADYEKKSPL